MISRFRRLSIGGLLLVAGVFLLLRQPSSSAVLYSGVAVVESGPLTLEVVVDPPVARPGDTLRLTARVSNRGGGALSPSVALRVPRGLGGDVFALPAGATFNLQENRIDWLPVVAAGQTQAFSLDLVVQTADVLMPEQSVTALLRHQGSEHTAAAPLWLGIPPLIGELLPQNTVAVGQPIQLQADVAGPGPLSAVWDLGDGRRLELADPVVVFPAAGQHEVTLQVANPGRGHRPARHRHGVARPGGQLPARRRRPGHRPARHLHQQQWWPAAANRLLGLRRRHNAHG
jgi:hypothetical protein